MFKLKGEVEIIKIDSRTSKIVEIIKQENLIPDNTLLELLSWDVPRNYFGGKQVSISTQTNNPSYSNATVNSIIATGYVPQNIVSPVWIETVEPPYGIVKNRIDFIGIARTFYTVALTNLYSNNNSPNESATAAAYLLLTLPCTQGEFEYLDIQYRIQFLSSSGQGFIDEKLCRYDFGRGCFAVTSSNGRAFRMSWLYASLFNKNSNFKYASGGNLLAALFPNPPYSDNNIWLQDGGSGERIDNHYKWKYKYINNRDTNVGLIFNLMQQGLSNNDNQVYTVAKFNYKEEPFQTGFWHSENATKPFFDASYTGSSSGKIYLSGAWIGNFPELYKITITNSGVTGVAKYKFSVLKHLGFNGNSFNSQDVVCPYIQTALQPAPLIHGWREENFDKHRYSNTQIAQYDDTGVTLLNVFNGDRTNWEALTTPALNATQIRQVAVDSTNGKIYVGCRQTGLWIINVAANTVTHQSTSPCYGVDVGRNNVAIALLEGGLYRSSNWSAIVPINYAGISDSRWNKVHFLKADPEDINDKIAFVIDNNGINRVVWYEFSNNTATTGYEGEYLPKYCASLDCSDNGSVWFFANTVNPNLSRIFFGESFLNGEVAGLGKDFTHSIYGYCFYQKVSFYQNKLFTYYGLLDRDDSANDIDYPDIGYTLNAIHLDSGITLFGKMLRQIFNDSALKWNNYGWDGSNWVKDNTGSKTTHVSADSLINGLSIRFQNGAAAPQFTATDFFTQGVNWGLLKDNATSIDSYISQWYTREVSFDTVFSGNIPTNTPYTLTLSAANQPNFLRLETDTPQLHEFWINNNKVQAVYVNGEPPGPNEVTIAPNGVITFNSVDAGKSFSAKYTYIKI